MNLVNDECVAWQDVAVLKPSARDAGGDDDDVPRRSLRRCFALAIDYADTKRVSVKNRLRDRTDRERLPRPGSGYDSESLPARGQLPNVSSVLTLENGVEVQAERYLDCLAGGASRRDDENSPRRWLRR